MADKGSFIKFFENLKVGDLIDVLYDINPHRWLIGRVESFPTNGSLKCSITGLDCDYINLWTIVDIAPLGTYTSKQ
jgi:hypothetical protein